MEKLTWTGSTINKYSWQQQPESQPQTNPLHPSVVAKSNLSPWAAVMPPQLPHTDLLLSLGVTKTWQQRAERCWTREEWLLVYEVWGFTYFISNKHPNHYSQSHLVPNPKPDTFWTEQPQLQRCHTLRCTQYLLLQKHLTLHLIVPSTGRRWLPEDQPAGACFGLLGAH